MLFNDYSSVIIQTFDRLQFDGGNFDNIFVKRYRYSLIVYPFYFSDAVVSQVLDELGLQLNDTLSGLPQTGGALPATGQKQPAAAAAAAGSNGGLSDADADLQARLDNLRRE